MFPRNTRPTIVDLLRVIEAQTQVVKAGSDLAAVTARAARIVLNLTPAQGAVVTLAEGHELVYRAAAGAGQPHLGTRMPLDGSLAGLSLQLGTALRCDDSEKDWRVYKKSCRKVGIRSMIVVPLRYENEPIGVFGAYSGNCGAFDDADMMMLQLMGRHLAALMFQATHSKLDAGFRGATHDP